MPLIDGALAVFAAGYTVAFVVTLRLLDFIRYLLPVLIPVGIVVAVLVWG